MVRPRRDSNSRPSASKAVRVKIKCLIWCRLRIAERHLVRAMIPNETQEFATRYKSSLVHIVWPVMEVSRVNIFNTDGIRWPRSSQSNGKVESRGYVMIFPDTPEARRENRASARPGRSRFA